MLILVLKYTAWLLSTGLAVAGSWFFKFTESDPDRAGRVRLTPYGKVGLPIAIVGLAMALFLTVREDMSKAESARRQSESAHALAKTLESQNKTLGEMRDALIVFIKAPDAKQAIASKEVETVAQTDPEINSALQELTERLGGDSSLLLRLRRHHPVRAFDRSSLLHIATFGLKFFNTKAPGETVQAVADVISGMSADVVALQEVDAGAVEALLKRLPGYVSAVGTSGLSQRLAFIWKADRLDLLKQEELDLTPDVKGTFTRKPLLLQVRFRGENIELINVHLRSQVGSGNVARQAELKALSERQASLPTDRSSVIIGVFQADLNAPEMRPLVEGSGFFPTTELPPKSATWISAGPFPHSMLSQMHLSGAARKRYVSKSVHITDMPATLPELPVREIIKQISDHNPLSIVFDFGR